MTKRKRNQPTIEEILERPWCYYCERDFDDLKILISHQRAKHYKCDQCGRRLNTSGGLSVHMSQVHKETLTTIENALPNRRDVTVEIFGMEGIPPDVLEQHKQRITSEYFRSVAERRAQTGNPPPGSTTQSAAKKPKIETAEELKARLAEHKARKEAERDGRVGTPQSTNSGNGVSPYMPPDHQHGTPPTVAPEAIPGNPMHALQYSAPPVTIAGGPPVMSPNGQFYPPPMAHGLSNSPIYGGGPIPSAMPFPPVPPPHMQQPGWPHAASPVQAPFPPFGTPAYSPGATNGFPPPSNMPPTKHNTENIKPQAPLEMSVPGLPARPSTNAPSFSREDMARMHAGAPARQNQLGLPSNLPASASHIPDSESTGKPFDQAPSSAGAQAVSDSIDDLIRSVQESKAESNAVMQANSFSTQPLQHALPSPPTTVQSGDATQVKSAEEQQRKETSSKKSGKKGKSADIKSKLVYSDNVTSPEEKRALNSRYAFKAADETAHILDQPGPAVTGAVRGPDDVLDSQSAH